MKRLFCLIAAAMMIMTAAAAEIDLSAMTDEELRTLRDQIDTELASRALPGEEDLVHENEYARIVLKSYEITKGLSGSKKITLNLEWTNKSDSADHLSWRLSAEAYADGISIHCSKENFYTDIRPNVTYQATVSCTAPSTAQQVEIFLTNWSGKITYKTYTFDLR